MSKIYVLYHAQCTDGTGSKFAAWKKFRDDAKYIPVNYGQPVPPMEPGSEIYILDFSYPRDVLEQLQSVHTSVVVLDHHKTAEEALKGVHNCHFDMHRSGCVMAWEYFHPGVKVPNLLLDIQDRDLWLFKRPNSKAVHAGLKLSQGKMELWDGFYNEEGCYEFLVDQGCSLLKAQEIDVASAVKGKIKTINFHGFKCGITNATDHQSEIGNAVCLSKDLNVDFAVVYCINTDNSVLLSYRSIGDFDVSALATKFKGGGHKNASGAKVGMETLAKILKGMM